MYFNFNATLAYIATCTVDFLAARAPGPAGNDVRYGTLSVSRGVEYVANGTQTLHYEIHYRS